MIEYKEVHTDSVLDAAELTKIIRNPPSRDKQPFVFSFKKYGRTHVAQVRSNHDIDHRTTNVSLSLGKLAGRLHVNLVVCHRDAERNTMFGIAIDHKIVSAIDWKTALSLMRAMRRSHQAGYDNPYPNLPKNLIAFDMTNENLTAWHLITAMTSGKYSFGLDKYGDAALYVDPDPEHREAIAFSSNTVQANIGGANTMELFKKAVAPYHEVKVDGNLAAFVIEHDGKAVVSRCGKFAYLDDDNFTLFTTLYSGS